MTPCETVRIPEKNKVPGVCYAVTADGLELPVIDITHPAFACDVSPQEVSAIIDESVRAWEAVQKTPPEVLRDLVANSLLVRGWVQSVGTFMSGMTTYLYRLGPNNLGQGYAGPIDRRSATGIMPLSFRFRLRDVARLIADALAPALAAHPGSPVHLVNIAGGLSADSLNALIVLNKEHPECVRGRPISIQVLDLDREGPQFGSRALAALLADGAPLAGLSATLDAVEYNWADASRLRQVLDGIEPGAAAVGSSEGGLFDYGSDEQIVANLAALREGTPPEFVMVGSVVRDVNTLDPRLRATVQPGARPLIRYLGLDAFRPLARQAGWAIERVIDSVAHHAVSLRKA
ncbi:MAG TPA: hypothetical protein VN428_18290 [Bryobacteraceae bacterium]|nr:hypothetical protein [Bryobacteraceae bacterium]